MKNTQDAIVSAKDKLPNVTPTPPGFKPQSSAHELKSRLEWGEPALTIIDVRDRDSFNDSHIMGALPMPLEQVVDIAGPSINPVRDIYVYGDSEEQTARAASQLREAGFQRVAELKGGLKAWKDIAGPTDGVIDSRQEPGPEAYNLFSRLKHHSETQKVNFQKP